ncbi:MAG: M14 family metallocarboxypeptidase [Verrucomicrobiae bacterium]|nr:M14 family metallocarboxypeptidase [Verrucomicrobiae bacterium]
MTEEEWRYLASHDAHDYAALLDRWRVLIEPCSLSEHTLSDQQGVPVMALRTSTFDPAAGREESGNVYLCAGVHGDEPAGVWGLLEWAETHPERLRDLPAIILPCFNPWGLLNNRRHDEADRDLNRAFHLTEVPLIEAWRELVGDSGFRIALHLHEDYDARGVYLYELSQIDAEIGEASLLACETIIPREPRSEVDGAPFENGLLRRGLDIERVVSEELGGGYPEAIWMFLKHAKAALTFETPSEYSLWRRVRAQRQFIEAALEAAGI